MARLALLDVGQAAAARAPKLRPLRAVSPGAGNNRSSASWQRGVVQAPTCLRQPAPYADAQL